MADWRASILEVLRDLGAADRFVVGSRLMQEILRREAPDGEDLRDHLRRTQTPFSRFLESFSPDVVVQLRGGQDMLVGLPGATPGEPLPKRRQFRKDVYLAFTRAGDKQWLYSPSADRFVLGDAEVEGALKGPSITRDLLLEERRAFAQTRKEDVREALDRALKEQNPLTAFMQVLDQCGIQNSWRRFHGEQVYDRIAAWCKANGLEIPVQWLHEEPTSAMPLRNVMELILGAMNDDEIRSLLVPIRAVEAALQAQSATRK